MFDNEISQRKRKADEDLRAYLAERKTTIGSHADAVRIFHPHIQAMRQADAGWEDVAEKLETWSGRKVAPATIKQYMTDINQGRMKLELSSTVGLQPKAPIAPPAPPETIPGQSTMDGSGSAQSVARDQNDSAGETAPRNQDAVATAVKSRTSSGVRFPLKMHPK